MPCRPGARLSVAQAIALGALHGPAELLPISSSGHVELVPWLLGWDYTQLDHELRKAFDVALHAGTAAGLLIALRTEVTEALHSVGPRTLLLICVSSAPAAFVGYALERPIQAHLGTPATIAGGLFGGAVALAWADRRPATRRSAEAGFVDALWLGVGQACALMPGVSRNGATLTAARLRRFRRADANRLSGHVALPVIAGATMLKGARLRRLGLPAGLVVPFVAGALASFGSTLLSAWLIRRAERDRSLLPYAVYRVAVAGVVWSRVASGGLRSRRGTPARRGSPVTAAREAGGLAVRRRPRGEQRS
jgi:undecaprenyl-diphosphatase